MSTPIPKTIHYCWFGRAELPSLASRCIKSWKEHCADYDVIEWNEDRFDVTEAPAYVQQAYDAGKWAFVSDYVRLFALYTYGGVYMDTDLEVIKPIDAFLRHRVFTGFESEHCIPTAVMGSEAKNRWIEMLMRDYDNRQFINHDGSYDYTTNVTVITKLTLTHYGIALDGTYQELADGVVIYPSRFFCPKNFHTQDIAVTDDTHTLHHFCASWADSDTRMKQELQYRMYRSIGMAFEAYERQDWRTAYRKALSGLWVSPQLALNKGVWSLILKSVWRDRPGRRRRDESMPDEAE